ncbi:uncharacterized protein LOC126893966 [Daktulosphaira vitifoliae]|uniref:uncharacterized protein LOC126893966 n=1 Tax=Daktulosphaira vitifoliae TaxID=58002 RepID=UPI0021AAB08C|nr:uncharacterized protein LOC126893966 [Daktulosphaira vitifoliae]
MNENIETQINDIKHLTLHHKVKRSWEGAGSAIKWLFGNADAEDVKRYDNMINKLDNDEKDILRIVHDQVSIIKSTISNFNESVTSFNDNKLIFDNNLSKISIAISGLQNISTNSVDFENIIITQSLIENNINSLENTLNTIVTISCDSNTEVEKIVVKKTGRLSLKQNCRAITPSVTLEATQTNLESNFNAIPLEFSLLNSTYCNNLYNKTIQKPLHLEKMENIKLDQAALNNLESQLTYQELQSEQIPLAIESNHIVNNPEPERRIYPYPVHKLFSLSLKTGVFPNSWKSSYVLPIWKTGDRSIINNYRPISKLSVLPKLFEKLIEPKLSDILKNTLINEQHGFPNTVGSGGQVDVIYTDIKKAFDTVDHSILIKKLSDFGFGDPILSWLSSYLTDRTQMVKINNKISNEFIISSGVLQEDDLKLYTTINSIDDINHLQIDLNSLFQWCSLNGLEINSSKCSFILFFRYKVRISSDYNIGDYKLQKVSHIRDLDDL